jgi:hypothetical protein
LGIALQPARGGAAETARVPFVARSDLEAIQK